MQLVLDLKTLLFKIVYQNLFMFIFLYADRVIEDVLVVIKSHTHILFRIIKDSLEVIYPIGHDPCD